MRYHEIFNKHFIICDKFPGIVDSNANTEIYCLISQYKIYNFTLPEIEKGWIFISYYDHNLQ